LTDDAKKRDDQMVIPLPFYNRVFLLRDSETRAEDKTILFF